MGGSLGRREATGRGVHDHRPRVGQHLGFELEGATVAVQGFGNVGSIGAELMHAHGARIIAANDWKGGVHNPEGLDMPALLTWVEVHKTVAGFPGSEPISNDQLFALDVDVLAPCALENQITAANQGSIKAKMVVEGANGPTTPTRTKHCTNAVSSSCPTFSPTPAASPPRTSSGCRDRHGYFWTEKEVNDRLEIKMVEAFDKVLATAKEHGVDMRTAAYIVAINRVATVTRMRGMYA